MAITNNFNEEASKLLANSLRNTGFRNTPMLGRINTNVANQIYRNR
jgi:hypothetical protein